MCLNGKEIVVLHSASGNERICRVFHSIDFQGQPEISALPNTRVIYLNCDHVQEKFLIGGEIVRQIQKFCPNAQELADGAFKSVLMQQKEVPNAVSGYLKRFIRRTNSNNKCI